MVPPTRYFRSSGYLPMSVFKPKDQVLLGPVPMCFFQEIFEDLVVDGLIAKTSLYRTVEVRAQASITNLVDTIGAHPAILRKTITPQVGYNSLCLPFF